jgi:outer membrane murein-binding lipoprotein Lpp
MNVLPRSLAYLAWFTLLSFFLSGCITFSSKRDELARDQREELAELSEDIVRVTTNLANTQSRLEEAKVELEASIDRMAEKENALAVQAQVSTKATQDILTRIDPSPANISPVNAARQFNGSTMSVLGLPPPDKVLPVDIHFSSAPQDIKTGQNQIDDLQREISRLQGQIVQLEQDRDKKEAKVDSISGELRAKAEELEHTSVELEEELEKQAWERIWTGMRMIFGWGGLIVAIIAIVVLFPVVIPLIGSLISSLLGMFPALMSWFRVTSKSSFENVVIGVDRVKNEIHSGDKSKTYSKEEVLALFSRHLGDQTDRKDKTTIDYVRRTKNTKMITSEPTKPVEEAKA